jgi:hypothetical protein
MTCECPIAVAAVMLNETLHCRTSTSYKVSQHHANDGPISRCRLMPKTQLYMAGATALWAYDYLLTLNDEVAGFFNDSDAKRNLTTLYRSATHGRRRASLVREHWRLLWSTLSNNIAVFVLFLFVSTLYPRHYANSDRRLDQVPSTTVPGVGIYL